MQYAQIFDYVNAQKSVFLETKQKLNKARWQVTTAATLLADEGLESLLYMTRIRRTDADEGLGSLLYMTHIQRTDALE